MFHCPKILTSEQLRLPVNSDKGSSGSIATVARRRSITKNRRVVKIRWKGRRGAAEKSVRLVEFWKERRGTELFRGCRRGAKQGRMKEAEKGRGWEKAERTLPWNGVDRKMPRFRTLSQLVRPCTFRFINSSSRCTLFTPLPQHRRGINGPKSNVRSLALRCLALRLLQYRLAAAPFFFPFLS